MAKMKHLIEPIIANNTLQLLDRADAVLRLDLTGQLDGAGIAARTSAAQMFSLISERFAALAGQVDPVESGDYVPVKLADETTELQRRVA